MQAFIAHHQQKTKQSPPATFPTDLTSSTFNDNNSSSDNNSSCCSSSVSPSGSSSSSFSSSPPKTSAEHDIEQDHHQISILAKQQQQRDSDNVFPSSMQPLINSFRRFAEGAKKKASRSLNGKTSGPSSISDTHSSSSSSLSSSSESSSPLDNNLTLTNSTSLGLVAAAAAAQTVANKSSAWDMLCQLINCKVAFKKQYNGKKYNWIQLAGHAGRFKPGDREGYILKNMDDLERELLVQLRQDILAPFVPCIDKQFYDEAEDKKFTEMQDLLYSFHNPSIMDIKIGVRTFLEEDCGDEKETKPRHDLYLKMIEMAPNEPTEQEHLVQAINKKRYMSWREMSTCSSSLGFRIEAIKKNKVSEREFYTVRERKDVLAHFIDYTDDNKYILKMYQDRLIDLRETLKMSNFFFAHEMIGSSLLFVHDEHRASIWMIDFGKTRPLPQGLTISHQSKWIEGNHEDGYLIGIQSLIDIFQDAIDN